jgi:hypothetical protein
MPCPARYHAAKLTGTNGSAGSDHRREASEGRPPAIARVTAPRGRSANFQQYSRNWLKFSGATANKGFDIDEAKSRIVEPAIAVAAIGATSNSAGLHHKKRLRLSHVRGPPHYAMTDIPPRTEFTPMLRRPRVRKGPWHDRCFRWPRGWRQSHPRLRISRNSGCDHSRSTEQDTGSLLFVLFSY